MSLRPISLQSRSAPDTRSAAARLQPLLAPGDLILLGGELGAGKTTFTQGLARAMGITEAVTSPTFTLVRSYHSPGAIRLIHADLYRLEHLQEVVDLGLAELLDEAAVAVIEWGELAVPVLTADYLGVGIDFGVADDDRILSFAAVGPRWAARLGGLRQALTSRPSTGAMAAGDGG